RILDAAEVQDVEQYLAGRLVGEPLPPLQEFEFTFDLSGEPNILVPGFVPHGDPEVSATATLTIRDNNTMDYDIVLSDDRYRVTQAHLYNINETSGTSGNPAHGDSIICWGGRWEDNAAGGNSSDFLVGHGYSNGRLSEVLADPDGWYLMLHTEGGHFATDNGGLITYDPNLSGPQETSVTGVPQSERANRYNNRVGKTLLDMVLREDNTSDPNAPFHDPTAPSNQNTTPFPDADGNLWVESDGNGGFQLTSAAISAGYDLTTEYLFYLYDDQGPSWDFGGPEGAMGGFLQTPILLGDLNFDDKVDSDDWLMYIAGLGVDMTGLTDEQSYVLGDLNGDQFNNHADLVAFKNAYEAFNSGSSFAQINSAVPEPSSIVLLLAAGGLACCVARRSAIHRNSAGDACE
ncbi:MAG: PEP-CTERM sorting domain-containing protein, partial [Aeoliella sp.]